MASHARTQPTPAQLRRLLGEHGMGIWIHPDAKPTRLERQLRSFFLKHSRVDKKHVQRRAKPGAVVKLFDSPTPEEFKSARDHFYGSAQPVKA